MKERFEAMNYHRAESNRLIAYEIERHEQAARDCEAVENWQQAAWHLGVVRALEKQRRNHAIDSI